MSVSVLRNNREPCSGGAGSPPQLAVTAAIVVPDGNSAIPENIQPVSLSLSSDRKAAVAAVEAAAAAVAVAAVVSDESAGRISSSYSANNNNNDKTVQREAVVNDVQQPQQVHAKNSQVTANFKNNANTFADVKATRQRACPSKNATAYARASTSTAPQSAYRSKRRVHSFSEDDSAPGRIDNFNPSYSKRTRFTAKSNSFYQYRPQLPPYAAKPVNSGYRRSDGRFPRPTRGNPLVNQPPAPNNTTQFLITDHEQRDVDVAHMAPSSSTEAQFSTTCDTDNSSRRRSSDGHASDDEFIEDPEFAAVCDDYNMERIMSLTRDEVNRQMLDTQKDNVHLNEKIELLKADNQRLRAMLRECGVEDVGAPPTLTVFPPRKATSPVKDAGISDAPEAETPDVSTNGEGAIAIADSVKSVALDADTDDKS